MALRMVKYLYVNDENGQLVADCVAGPAVHIPSLDDNGHVLADQTRFEKIASPLPPANAENEGRIVTHQHSSGALAGPPYTKTQIYICVRSAAGDYEWIKIGEST